MKQARSGETFDISRRRFLRTVGLTAASVPLTYTWLTEGLSLAETTGEKEGTATVRGAFVYPPSESLRKAGYYSWPGSTFDAEKRQQQYMERLRMIERDLGMRISMDTTPLDTEADATRFINDVQASKPDGLLLIPFKKGHWPHVVRIVEETKIPAVVLATLGILLVDHINQLHRTPGVYLINSLDNLDAVAYGMRMIRTARRMKDSRIANIVTGKPGETTVPHLGTRVKVVPHARFVDQFNSCAATDAVKKLAREYLHNAQNVVEPSEADILDAARTYFVLKQIIADENADAMMMDCLPGLAKPRKHPPPCMGFMTLRDEGIPAGCQADLNATLTMMLVQQLFDKPGFQQNASMDTEKNHYFGAHCTSPSKMNGVDGPAEPYVLRSHAEAGWGCVPRVLFTPGQEVTMALYLSGKSPQMIVYSGEIVCCPPIPPTGGCRTNIEMTINEVDDVCDVKGMHQAIFYGNRAEDLRKFCQLYDIKVVV